MAEFVHGAFRRRADVIVTFLIIGIPFIMMAAAGAYYIITEGYFLELVLLSSACGLTLFVYRYFKSRRKSVRTSEDFEIPARRIEPSWSPSEQEVFKTCSTRIRNRTRELMDWNEGLFQEAYEVAHEVADLMSDGKRDGLDVNFLELLVLLDQVGGECREYIQNEIVFSFLRNISVNNTLWILRNRHYLATAATSGDYLYKLASVVMNPPVGAVRVVESLVMGNNTKYLTEQFQIELQRGMLEYVAAKSINLYSGRYKIDAQPVTWARTAEPIRILVVGQTGAGKSSLAAALATSAMTKNDGNRNGAQNRERIVLNGIECTLIERPGIDGNLSSRRWIPGIGRRTLENLGRKSAVHPAEQTFLNCDMVIWVARADQPARKVDVDHLKMFRRTYGSRKWRLVPPMLVAITHIDRPPLISQWPKNGVLSPAQELSIGEAINAAARAFDGCDALPVKLSPPAWNLDKFVLAIKSSMPDACLAQNNRLRSKE